MNHLFNRRQFLKTGAGTAGVFALTQHPVAKAFAATCGLTPTQTAGPFYPGGGAFHTDQDLTLLPGHTTRALGKIAYIEGKVLDENCLPISGANVEIWQACASGRYNHNQDPNPAPIDPNFRYWAETFTNEQGEYRFKTIIPGAYPAAVGWDRPPHIHFRISRLGYRDLITQMYFRGESLNDHDQILNDLSSEDRERVIVDFQSAPIGSEPESVLGNFDITLRKVRP